MSENFLFFFGGVSLYCIFINSQGLNRREKKSNICFSCPFKTTPCTNWWIHRVAEFIFKHLLLNQLNIQNTNKNNRRQRWKQQKWINEEVRWYLLCSTVMFLNTGPGVLSQQKTFCFFLLYDTNISGFVVSTNKPIS